MRTTKLRLAAVAASAAVLVGGLSSTAGAEQRKVIVTLEGGRQIVLTLDLPAGSGVDPSMIPDLGAPVISVVDGGPAGPPAVTATTPPVTQPPATQPTTQAPATTPSTPTITTPPTIPTTPSTPANPAPPAGTTGTGTTPPAGTGTTPPTGTGTTGTTTGTTPTTTTPPRTSTQAPAIGGVVKPKGQGKDEGSAVVVPRRGAARGGEAALRDALGGGDPTTTEDDEVVPIDPNDGAQPMPADPGYTVAPTLTTPLGVPNFFIEQFRIPPFLLPIYQAAGMQYGVPWQILAAINEIETDYGRNLSVSSAGALGWMQFMPPSWEAYGVDANGDGVKDPYNPVDAIFAAGRYLKAAGAETDLERAIFAYNHADWYVQSVLLRARVIGGMPADVVGSLTGLTQARFPVAARATYADSLDARTATRRQQGANAAVSVEGDPERRSINIYARDGAPVVAVNDGRIVKVGESRELGRFVVLEDVYGNRFTYSRLGSLAEKHPVPKPRVDEEAAGHDELDLGANDRRPTQAASDTQRPDADAQARDARAADARDARAADARDARARDARGGRDSGARDSPGKERVAANAAQQSVTVAKERLFANPSRPAAYAAGGERQLQEMGERVTTFEGYFTGALDLDPDDYVLKPLRVGSEVIAGTVLGRIGRTREELAPHVEFTIRPAGRGAPRIDPKPILDGWKLLESTAIYKADDSLFGRNGDGGPSIGQILLMSKQELQTRVLNNPNIEIYECGRDDIKAGIVEQRVLATMEYLAASGLKPTISSLQCGHGYLTSSGNVSHHSTGTAMDIAAINGITITSATQGEGSITDITVRRLLELQGTMRPAQIITLMEYPGTDNTLAMADHDDHIHVGWSPGVDATAASSRPRLQTIMKPEQWTRLVDQLRTIQNPVVPTRVSRYAIKDGRGE